MLALFAAALAASTSAPILESSVPWFERIEVTFDDKGAQKSCRYESSLDPSGSAECAKEMAQSIDTPSKGTAGTYSKLTFERRFSPGAKLDSGKLKPGDKLLSQQVLFLTIDAQGAIGSCKVLATSGDLIPAYDCDQAKTEKFRAQAATSPERLRQAFMTVLVYGHVEQIV